MRSTVFPVEIWSLVEPSRKVGWWGREERGEIRERGKIGDEALKSSKALNKYKRFE